MRGEVARVRSLLARQLTLESAVRLDDAKLTLARAELEGAQLGDEALLAEIQLARGGLLASNGEFEESAEALVDAVWMGLRARHQSVAIRAATRLVFVTGDHLQDTAAAELWFELAQSLLIAAEVEDSPMWADLWQVRGAMLRRAERHDGVPAVGLDVAAEGGHFVHDVLVVEDADRAELDPYGDRTPEQLAHQ